MYWVKNLSVVFGKVESFFFGGVYFFFRENRGVGKVEEEIRIYLLEEEENRMFKFMFEKREEW